MADRSKVDAAQAGFKKLMRDQDGKKAMSEYELAGVAVRAKTERLRALRLARDAAESAAAPVAAPAKKATAANKKPAKKTKGAVESLSVWLKDRESSGHNN